MAGRPCTGVVDWAHGGCEPSPHDGRVHACDGSRGARSLLRRMENSCETRTPDSGGRRMNAASVQFVLEARAVTKRYPGTVALDNVTFRVHRNQVNVLIGENGAGKSTLMRILAGVELADSGELFLEGEPILVRSPREAASLGISIDRKSTRLNSSHL